MGGFFQPIFFAFLFLHFFSCSLMGRLTSLVWVLSLGSRVGAQAGVVLVSGGAGVQENRVMSGWAAVEQTVTGLGYDLVDVERAPRGLLRVYIDRLPGAAGGEFVTVEDCERVTRQLQHVLEVEALPYERLEVSSPGLDRPLKTAAHYARFAGQEIEIQLHQAFQGRKKYRGLLMAQESAESGAESGVGFGAQGRGQAEGGSATCSEPASSWRLLFTEGKVEQVLEFSLSEVREARLVPVVDFKGRRFMPAPDAAPDQAQASTKE
jgi:ribosome maturation factor RimP